MCNKLAEDLKNIALVEREPRVEGRNMVMILAPRLDAAKGDNANDANNNAS